MIVAVAEPRAAIRPLTASRALVLAVAVAAVLVVPRAAIDYGQSGDAWDNARDAAVLSQQGLAKGVPQLVRFPPGIPLFLYLLVPVAALGPIATNAVVFAGYLAAVWLFWRLVRDEPSGTVIAPAFALMPIVVKNAALTQDFVVGLALILAACVLLKRSRYAAAGIFIGLAAGMRVTHILFLFPIAAWIVLEPADLRIKVRRIASIAVLACAVAGLLFLPLILHAGPGIFVAGASFGTFSLRGALPAAAYNLVSVFGVLALIGMLGLLLLDRRHVTAAASAALRGDRLAVFALLAIVLHLAVAIRFTMKPEYFMPAVPFVLVLAGRALSRASLLILCVLLISYSVFAIELKGGRSGQRQLAFSPAPGLIVADYLERRQARDLREGLASLRPLGRAVVLTGMSSALTLQNPHLEAASRSEISPSLGSDAGWTVHRVLSSAPIQRVKGSDVFLLSTLSRPNVDALKRHGYAVYMFSEYAPGEIAYAHGYDPYKAGIAVLEIAGPSAFYRTAFQ